MTDGLNTAMDNISVHAERSMWRRGTPGLVLGITNGKEVMGTFAKGVADYQSRRPLSVDMLFQIGSVSKSFTCMALLQLAEQGLVDVMRPVKDYLPWFSVRSTYPDITLHHLMTHTAGIVIGADATPTGWTEVWDLRDTDTSCEPGVHFHYSNSGYKALGLVLETVAGRPYASIIREGILEGAGMRSTEPVIVNDIRGRLAVAHMPLHDDRPFVRGEELYPATWFEGDTADGSICAPVEDMLAYIRVIMNRGEGPWGRLISPESFRLMATPYIQPDDELHTGGYGYGLNVEKIDGHLYLGHQGGMVGHYTSMLMDMDSGIGVMVMINGPGDAEEVARFAVETMRAHLEGRPLPHVPSKEEICRHPRASEYVGAFSGPDGTVEIVEKEGDLRLRYGGRELPIEHSEREEFLVHGPGFELFPLDFERKEGKVERVHHGPRTFVREGHDNEERAGHMDMAARYVGHYRSHNPWQTNFRIVERGDRLVFILPQGEAHPLTHEGEDRFRIGSHDLSPESILFDCFVNGVATSANVSGGGRFGRTFTP